MTVARRGTAAARAAAVLGVLGSLLVALLVSAPAAEAASYRYWTYWWVQPEASSWTFAQLGPASHVPKDGSVIGWRFAVTTEAGGAKTPRAKASFASLCPGMGAAASGEKRVAVVVDYGTTGDAPPGETPPGAGTVRVECVTAAADARAVAVLGTAGVALRWGSNGLVCGIDGYPRTECAAIVADPTPTPTRTSATPTPKPTTARPSTTSAEPGAVAGSTSPPEEPSSAAADPTSAGPASAEPSSSSAAATPTATEPPAEESEAPLPVSSGAPVASGTEGGTGSSPAGPAIGVALVLALGAGAWWTARGRRA